MSPTFMPKKYRFQAEIQPGRGGGAYVLFPFDVEQEFGTKARVPVNALLNGVPYTTELVKYGNPRHMLPVPKEIRAQTQTGPADTVRLEVWKDEAPRTIQPPDDLAGAMKRAGVTAFFDSLSFTHRKEYCRWITEAKKEETRLRRLAQAVEMLGSGIKTPDQKRPT